MRKLVIMRGHQGSGKSTFIERVGLDGYVLSPDAIRRMLASPVMDASGRVGVDQKQNNKVWRMTHDVLAERMARGELVVVDATHPRRGDFKHYLELAREHRYRVCCVDFSSQPIEIALAQNRARSAYAVVPEEALRKTYASCQAGEVPDSVDRIWWAPDGGHEAALEAWLTEPMVDLSGWPRVHHIGDLQGCFTPLWQHLGEAPPKPDEFYVFVGDLCDRGIENHLVVQHLLEWSAWPNVKVVWGNHEDHLHTWAVRGRARSGEFNTRTLPQLAKAGITRQEVDALCDRFVEFFRYTWRGRNVLVTHGGFPVVPDNPERLSGFQLGHGPGFYTDAVDAEFSANAPDDWFQMHGHRNIAALPIEAAPRSYNLEGKVEFGGHLRVVTLDERGFTPIEIRNAVFKPLPERLADETVKNTDYLPPWVTPDLPPPILPDATLAALRQHPLVQEKPAGSRPHVAAFNFTRDAFFDQAWDALNTTARGLFVNTDTGEIVARAYDKFFNVGERPETQPEALGETLVFPVSVYRKDNGYLGILGYDAVTDDLFFASKSTPDSEFAAWFREILAASITPGQLEGLRRFLRDTQSAMAFEVIDPVRDPHIIDYETASVVLLDVIRRAPTFEVAPYETLTRIAKRFGLTPKAFAMRFTERDGLLTWMTRAGSRGYRFEGQHIEGFVIEDSAGFMTKLKLDYYNFWKRMRGLKQRILRTRGSAQPLGRDVSDPRVNEVYTWMIQQPDAVLEQDICAMRRDFETGADHSGLYLPPKVEHKAVTGYRRALDALAQVETIKPGAADGLIARALADEAQLEVLRESPLRLRLLLAASPGDDRDDAAELLGIDLDRSGELR